MDCLHAPYVQNSPLKAALALETDGELYQLLGGTTASVTNYVGQLVACERCCRSAAARAATAANAGGRVGAAALAVSEKGERVNPFTPIRA